ncbi:hypothetical protein ACI8AF_22525 [Blastococcus sp. SYSU D00669]
MTPSAQLIAETIGEYVAAELVHERWIAEPVPLTRWTKVRTATWRPWLRDGGSHRPKSRCTPYDEARTEAALAVLDGLTRETHGRADARIERRDLLARSEKLSSDGDEGLIGLWVATMIWGSGMTNGRGPWRTAQGLAHGPLVDVLRETARLVRADQLDAAFQAFRVTGCGVSFFTKWFWAVSLAAESKGRAYVLDKRVVDCLILMHTQADVPSRRWWGQYAGYLDDLEAAAERLSQHYPGIDAEKVEYLLFEREAEIDDDRPPLIRWLERRGEA